MTDEERPTGSKTRDSKRVNVEAFVRVSGAEREFVLRTRDLSESGLFLFTRVAHIYPFRVGSTLSLELYDYDSAVHCKVVVVRVVEPGSGEADSFPSGFGVKFVDIKPEDRERLRSMIDRVSEKGALY